MCVPRERQEGRIIMAIKFCTKCGKKFESVGREVICPSCKAAAQEETKRAAVLRAKRASWNGESVPVRISGRASTVIRRYGAAHDMPFAAALDALLQASDFFASTGKAWDDITPYKSHRRSKSTTEDEQAGKQDAPQTPQTARATKVASKTSKATSKTAAGKKA